MNAVDAAEELMAVGRRVLALEQRLRQPVGVAAPAAMWAELAADPMARLAGLLAPYARPVAVAERAEPEQTSSPFSWRPRTDSSDRTEATAPLPERPWSSARAMADVAAPAASSEPSAGSGVAHREHPTAQGAVQLKRDSSSLLAILQSNLRAALPDDAGRPAHAGSRFMPAQNDAMGQRGTPLHSAGQIETDFGNTAIASNQPRTGTALNPTEEVGRAPAASPLWFARPTRGQRAAPGSPSSFSGDDRPVTAGFIGLGAGQAIAAHGESESGQRHHEFVAGDGIAPAGLWPAAVASRENAMAWPPSAAPSDAGDVWQEPAAAPAPLSDEQLDQILDALDARLELMLLRMYGTSAF